MTDESPKGATDCEDEDHAQIFESSQEVHRLTSSVYGFSDNWSPRRRAALHILRSLPFELAVGVVTLFNLVVVVVETNERAECRSAGHSDDHCDESIALRMLNVGCLLIYIAEISFRLYVDQMKFLKNWWNCSDVIVVCLSGVAEVFNTVFPSLGFLRMFRTLRLFRTVRILTIQRELYMLVHGFISTMKALFWAAILMLGLLTMWSILAVEVLHPINLDVSLYSDAYEDCSRCSRSFASVWDANLTFFNTVVLGDGWADFIFPVVDREYWTLFIFMGVAFSVGLGLVNLILAVIVDRAREAHEEDVDHQHSVKQQKMDNAKKTMRKMFAAMDVDNSGNLSLEELMAGYDDSQALRQVFNVLDVERDDIECVFKIMDADDSGDVSYQEFADNLYRMKAHNSRTLLVFIKFYVTELRRNVQEELQLIKGDILSTLKTHTHLLSNLTLSAPTVTSSFSKSLPDQEIAQKKKDGAEQSVTPTFTSSFSKSLLDQEIAQKKKDGAEESVTCAELEEDGWARLNAAAPMLHPYTIQEKEPCSDNVMPSDDLLETLARADSLHKEAVAGMCPAGESETERPVLATSEVMPLPATAGPDSQGLANSFDAVMDRGSKQSRAPELPRQSLPGQFECEGVQQSTSSPPEPGIELE